MIAISCLEDSIPQHPFSTLAGSYIFLPIFLNVLERDFSIDFELLFPHPLQIFFLAKTFHENGAFLFSTLDRCTRNLNWLGNVAWRMRFIQVAADGGKYLQRYF